MTKHLPPFPKFPQSYWLESSPTPVFPELEQDLQVDVAVVGAGITGITTAYILSGHGLNVALIEAGVIGQGTTGHTTAKLTTQHDLIYDELISHFGKDKARQYYDANNEAVQWMKQMIREEGIDCQLTDDDAYIYGETDEESENILAECGAYKELELPGGYAAETQLPFQVRTAIAMRGQAWFNPIPYVTTLCDRLVQRGGKIFGSTTIIGIDEGEHTVLHTQSGFTVTCRHAVSTSHYPFHDLTGLYFTRLHAQRSYAMLIRTRKPFPGGMYLSAGEPKRSLRPVSIPGGHYGIVGGEGHKTGQGICTFGHYEALRDFAEEHLGIEEILYRWSAQDLFSLDKLPYIGPQTNHSPSLLVATGFRKWGMSTSAVAARLISDLILGKDNPYAELFSPSRLHLDPDVKTFVKQNVNVAKHLIAGKLGLVHGKVEDLGLNEGGVVRFNGRRAGAYRDEEGNLHLVNTACTHMGCETEWNEAERTWDCPCHGSRFSYKGHVVEGPAKEPLATI